MSKQYIRERWKGIFVGALGGLAGWYAMRFYWRNVAPLLFPYEPGREDVPNVDPPSPFGKQFERGETATMALGRIIYTEVTDQEPESAETRALLGGLTFLACSVIMGAFYGMTRRVRRPVDVIGALFYGLWLWMGDTFIAAFLGLRAGPEAFSTQQHVWRLSGHWIYSFITANVTRVLYRFL
mgnify:CR=1 FL=1